MKISKQLLIIITVALFSTISFLTGIQFERSTIKTNPPQAETSEIPQSSQSPQLPQQATVSRVIDGDTIELSTGQTVRYTGITAPEKVEPFYQEATNYNQKLTLGKQIRLEYEKGYEQDKFGRFLAYVFVTGESKETFVNLELVKAGLAKVSIYEKRRPLIYQEQLLNAQSDAQKNRLGVWSSK